MKLKDKIAIVTGAGSGIGRAMATRFIQEGARQVVIADLHADSLTTLAAEIGARAIKTDVANEQEVIHLIRTVEQDYGQIDLLCNNAGIGGGVVFSGSVVSSKVCPSSVGSSSGRSF